MNHWNSTRNQPFKREGRAYGRVKRLERVPSRAGKGTMTEDLKDWNEYRKLNQVKRYRADFKRVPACLVELEPEPTPDDQEQ